MYGNAYSSFGDGLRRRDWRLLVAGRLSAAADGSTSPVEDPSLGTTLCEVPFAGPEDVELAVSGALQARAFWGELPARDRGRLLRRLADAIDEHAEELALLDSFDAGIPVTVARQDVRLAIDSLEMFADWALLTTGQTIPASTGNLHLTLREPFGVVGRIIPFNHPFLFAVSKIAAPLVAGNCVVLKLPDQAPLSGLRLGEIAAEILPPGTLSILAGSGASAGDALVRAPRVLRIAFTGSLATGLAIQRAAAAVAVKHVSLELGGKNAMIVFPDADLGGVVEGAVRGMNLGFAGQSCGSNSRLLVHQSIADEVTAGLCVAFQALRVGPAWDDDTQVGPLVSARQHARVIGYLESAVAEGLSVGVGGGRPPELPVGHFVAPTVLEDVHPGDRVFEEEIFGPVISVVRFDAEAGALAMANAVEYGLTASVWTNDVTRAHRVAGAVEAGYVWINDSNTHYPGTPFGGYKNSGTGREESLDELLSYTQLKTVHVRLR